MFSTKWFDRSAIPRTRKAIRDTVETLRWEFIEKQRREKNQSLEKWWRSSFDQRVLIGSGCKVINDDWMAVMMWVAEGECGTGELVIVSYPEQGTSVLVYAKGHDVVVKCRVRTIRLRCANLGVSRIAAAFSMSDDCVGNKAPRGTSIFVLHLTCSVWLKGITNRHTKHWDSRQWSRYISSLPRELQIILSVHWRTV